MTKILLVEDDKSLREIYSVRLLAEGYTLISSGDGEEALAAAIGEKPDLIISDVMMPKISGFEMLDLLRSNDATKNIPVIMLTALSSEQQRERGDRLGADRYLIKSQVGIEDIVRTVHEVLGDGGTNRNLDQMQTSVATSAVHPAQSASGTSVVSPQPQTSSPLFPANTTESTTGSTNASTNTGNVSGATLPKLSEHEYNYIRFATVDEINEAMPLEINPAPDTIIRVLMTYKGLDEPLAGVKEQQLPDTPTRTGFTAVEWGGSEIRD